MYMYGEYETAEVAKKGSVKVEEALSKTSCMLLWRRRKMEGRPTDVIGRKENNLSGERKGFVSKTA